MYHDIQCLFTSDAERHLRDWWNFYFDYTVVVVYMVSSCLPFSSLLFLFSLFDEPSLSDVLFAQRWTFFVYTHNDTFVLQFLIPFSQNGKKLNERSILTAHSQNFFFSYSFSLFGFSCFLPPLAIIFRS
jgi:hypothetical protein